MYSLCKQTHPVTTVEHSVYCHFFNWKERNLVLASADVLRVFRLFPDVGRDEDLESIKESSVVPKMKLECVATFNLFGTVMAVQSVTLTGSSRDSLLVSFKDAKLSILEYDPATHYLATLSLHYFEDADMREGWTRCPPPPMVRVDPENRCAVMLVYGRKLVILPFRREMGGDELEHINEQSNMGDVRSPILASYTIILKDLDEKLDNVIDMQFLHGYYEPTLLILYEPIKTFPGRIAIRNDTCSLVAISLNTQQRVHPIIWAVTNLPFDCTQAISVPKPIGGALVMATNSLMYLNQSIPPYGVALNSLAATTTNFPLKTQDCPCMTLDSAHATFISNERLVVSLKGGQLYVLTLLADSMRTVRNFHFDKAAASVLTSCMTVCEESFLFLGSRLGNSLLLRFLEKEYVESAVEEIPATIQNNEAQPPPAKKKKLDSLGDWMASDVSDIKDVDELEVYGANEDKTSVPLASYIFEVCDSLLNIGPCGNVSMGEPAFLSEEFSTASNPDVELVTTSGYGKNGALCVIQRSIRPQVATTFDLPECLDMWTVICNKSQTPEAADASVPNSHAFLILSRADSSLILETGQEINEVDISGFSTQTPTIFAGNLGNNKYIIQVSPTGLRLLQGLEQIQHLPLDLGSPVIQASVVDPHCVLLTEDGQLVLLTLKELRRGSSARLVFNRLHLSQKSKVVAISTYYDMSGMFTTMAADYASTKKQKAAKVKLPKVPKHAVLDEEDELLYGEASEMVTEMSETQVNGVDREDKDEWWHTHLTPPKPSFWLVLAKENSSLEIHSLPDFQMCFLVKHFGLGNQVLVNSLGLSPNATGSSGEKPSPDIIAPPILEILLVGLGHWHKRPLLLAHTQEELLIYEAFPYYDHGVTSHLLIRFRKVSHGLVTDELTRKENRTLKSRPQQLRYFTNIAGYNGVFLCGSNPHWLLMTSRGEMRIHPMTIDGPIPCFAPFHNINCWRGLLYFNNKSQLRICVLPTHLSYDAPWPVRKVPLRCTPLSVTYHMDSKTFCVVTTTGEPTDTVYKFNGEDKEPFTDEKDDKFPFPIREQFSLQIFSPVSWEVIPNTKLDLEEWEHVTCLKNVSLSYEGARSGLKDYIAVGTNFNYSEDITSRGRILILDIIEVVPEPGQPLTKNKFKTLYAKEQKGPVTAITQIMGFLVSAVGQKIYMWQLKDNDLVGIAFIDTQIYIHQMISIKKLLLVADVCKSISLLSFQETFRTLSLVSRDFRPLEPFAIEYMIDNNHLGFLASDSDKNILVFMYQPESRESYGGQRLIRKADFHFGQSIHTFFRIRCRTGELIQDQKQLDILERRHVTMFATLDGAMGYLLPLNEKTYRRLLMLQNVLVFSIPHIGGLNPKAYRTYQGSWRHLSNPSRGIIDGELIWKYLTLSLPERVDIARKIGTRPDEIIDDLTEIQHVTAHF